MFLGFLGPQNLKNDKIYFRIIIRFIRYGHYPVTSLIYILLFLRGWGVDRSVESVSNLKFPVSFLES